MLAGRVQKGASPLLTQQMTSSGPSSQAAVALELHEVSSYTEGVTWDGNTGT